MRSFRQLAASFGPITACVAVGLGCAWLARPGVNTARTQHPTSGISRTAAASEIPQRRVYRYSIVPGGVETAEEAIRAVRTDTVVAAHYAGLDLPRLTVRHKGTSAMRYVSYRRNNRVLWTKTRHRVAAGELVLTDGRSEVRARCGNRLSEVPQEPVDSSNEGEPDDSELASYAFDDLPREAEPRFEEQATFPAMGSFPGAELLPTGRPVGHPAMSQVASLPGTQQAGFYRQQPGGFGLVSGTQAEPDRLPVAAELLTPPPLAPVATPVTPSSLPPWPPVPESVFAATNPQAAQGRAVVRLISSAARPGGPTTPGKDPSANPRSEGPPPGRPSSGGGGDNWPGGDLPGTDEELAVEPEPVPEPGTWLMALSGVLLALAGRSLTRYRQNSDS